MSFTLLQYKRLDPGRRSVSVDDQFTRQLDRLDEINKLSKASTTPQEWRLSTDSCFLKLAHWHADSKDGSARRTDHLAPGLYLPLSYARLLLGDDSTLSKRTRHDGTSGRVLGYDKVPRRMSSTQFIELVQHGQTGTVGVTVDKLRALVDEHLRNGRDQVVVRERSRESALQRDNRLKARGAPKRTIDHVVSHASTEDHSAAG